MKVPYVMTSVLLTVAVILSACSYHGLFNNSWETSSIPELAEDHEMLYPAYEPDVKKWGYINDKGEWMISPQYDSAWYFEEGFAEIKSSNKSAIINLSGEVVFELPENWVFVGDGAAHEDLWMVLNTNNRLRGYISFGDEIVIEPQFRNTSVFSEGLAYAENDEGKAGYINKSGKWMVPAIFDGGGDFSEGMAAVKKEGKWGYITKKGRWKIDPQFDRVTEFKDGVAGAQVDEKWGIIDTKGKWVVEPIFEDIGNEPSLGICVKLNENWGMIDTNGEWIIEPKFCYAFYFSEGLAATGTLEYFGAGRPLEGYIDTKGNWVIEPQFAWATRFRDGIAQVDRYDPDSKDVLEPEIITSYINRSGEIIYEWHHEIN